MLKPTRFMLAIACFSMIGCGNGPVAQEPTVVQSNVKEYVIASLSELQQRPKAKSEDVRLRLEALSESLGGMISSAGSTAPDSVKDLKSDVDGLADMARSAKPAKEIQSRVNQVMTKAQSL